ncbi:MAG: hypothetical protein AAB873_01475 [Patescibacteria group bacterium]
MEKQNFGIIHESRFEPPFSYYTARNAFYALVNNYADKKNIKLITSEGEGNRWLLILKDGTKVLAEDMSFEGDPIGMWTKYVPGIGLTNGDDILIPQSDIKEVLNPYKYDWSKEEKK